MKDEFGNISEKVPAGVMAQHVLRKIFLEDWMTKAAALAITLALWFGVTGLSTPTTRKFTGIPLALVYSNNIEVTNSPIQEIDIVISGDKRRISQINKNDLSVSLDISDIAPGDRVIQLTPENVALELPTGVKLDEIQPSRMAVRIEAVDERDIPVQAETEGDPPEGYELYEQIIAPATVRVRGPVSFIRALNFVSTERIDLTGKQADFTARQVPVSVSNAKSTVLDPVVDVTFRIGEKRVERQFSVAVANEPFKRATVILFGGRSILDGLTNEDLSVEVIEGQNGEVRNHVMLPPGLENRVEARSIKIN